MAPISSCWTRAGVLALAMTALGRALQIRWGMIGPEAQSPIFWLSLAIVLTAAALFAPIGPVIGNRGFRYVAAACLLVDYAQIVTHYPSTASQLALPENRQIFIAGSLIAAFLSFLVVFGKDTAQKSAALMLIVVFALLGNWIITATPEPGIDVYEFQTNSADALSRGVNPYGITFADPYGPIGWYTYAPRLIQNGRLMFGYPYLPETLFDVMPFHWLHVTLRYAQLIALVCTAAIIVLIRVDLPGFAAVTLFLATPQLFYVLEQGWTEPLVVIWLAATILCQRRWPRALPITLGLFLASKQYIPAFAVLVFARPRPNKETVRLLVLSSVIAALITAPLALWNFSAFWRSAVRVQLDAPFRIDALSIAAWLGGAAWPASVQFILPFSLLLGSISLVIWHRRAVSLSAGVAFCSILFFAFNKQAFANYYLFVIVAMACAIAELDPGSFTLEASSLTLSPESRSPFPKTSASILDCQVN